MTKSTQTLRKPAGLTIDKTLYDQLRGQADYVYFEISDGRNYYIETALLDQIVTIINRGQGVQLAIRYKYLHHLNENGNDEDDRHTYDTLKSPYSPKTPQLAFNFGDL